MPPVTSPAPLEVCNTQACINAAASMQNYINFNVDPCDDFWQFSCGTFIDNTVLTNTTTSAGTFDELDMNILTTVRDILSKSYDDLLGEDLAPDFVQGANYSVNTDRELFGHLQQYYNSCMDEDAINALGPTPLYPFISNLDAAAAAASSSFSDQASVHTAMLIHTHVWDAPGLFSTSVKGDYNNPHENVIYIFEPTYKYATGFDLTNPKHVETLHPIFVNMVKAVLSPEDPFYQDKAKQAGLTLWPAEDVEARVANALQLMVTLENNTGTEPMNYLDPENQYNGVMPLSKLQENYPVIDWPTYFRYFVPEEQPLPGFVLNYAPVYFEEMTRVLANTDLQTFKDYLTIQLIMSHVTDIDSTTRAFGKMSTTERWLTCAANVRENFDHVIGRFYVMSKFGGAAERNQMNDFVTHIHQAWAKRLDELDWLDEATHAKAAEKINNLGQWIAYNVIDPNTQSPDSLADYLKPMVFSDNYGTNQFVISHWLSTKKKYGVIGKPVDRSNFGQNPIERNAFYYRGTNYMAVLAGIIQEPMYNSEYPAYINYGALGSVIGHEFTHGFDNNGRNYDAEGRLTVWWTNETSQVFDDRSQCFINQYSKFYVTDDNNERVYVNAQSTLGENLADNGGIAASFRAYKEVWNSGTVKQVTLPNINLTPDQLFFTSFARFYCRAATPATLVAQIGSDDHAPNFVRVLATVQNSPEFATAFQCPPGSKMNPPASEKCSLW
ncbi:hypothetical protein BX666DRAFT_2021977 [Dichotomocladium elegans]|nr:hypothetical protein BX666DRAFT_2021977 [Dichotomocladium elegans]